MDAVSNGNVTEVGSKLGLPLDFLTDAQYWTALGIFMMLGVIAGVLATGANVINIVVYFKMGFSDSINISLTALALSDLGVAVTTVGAVVCHLLPSIPNVPFTIEIFYFPVSFPHVYLCRVSALITAYISLERCLCVLIPLRVKTFITPTKTLSAMVIFYGLVWCLYPIGILRHPIGWKFYPERNKTLLGVLPVVNPVILFLDKVQLLVASSIIPLLTFSIVLVCTILLIVSLQRSKAWRETNSGVRNRVKETKVIKMVITMAVVFIVTTIPLSIVTVVTSLVKDFSFDGRNLKLNHILGVAFFGVNSLNSGANILIYYKMSGKFRQSVNRLLKKRN